MATISDLSMLPTVQDPKALYQPVPIMNLSTQTLRTLLPYRSAQEGIYHNEVNLGFALQLFLHKPSTMHTIQQILQDILRVSNGSLHYSLHMHHHRYPKNSEFNYHYYIFVSAMPTPNQIDALAQGQQYLKTQLARYHVAFSDLKTIDFLIFLRTLISPNLDCAEGPGLIDVHHKSFHTIIPNPGTMFVLSADHIDIFSTNALGDDKKVRVLLNQIGIIQNSVSIWAPLNDISETLDSDWLLSVPINPHSNYINANFVLFSSVARASEDQLNVQKHYTDYGINLQTSLTPLRTFLTSLPFWQTDCSDSLS